MRNSGEGTGGSPPSGSLLFIVYSFVLLNVLSLVKCICICFFQNLPGAECTMANRTEVPQSGARQKVEFRGQGRAQRNH